MADVAFATMPGQKPRVWYIVFMHIWTPMQQGYVKQLPFRLFFRFGEYCFTYLPGPGNVFSAMQDSNCSDLCLIWFVRLGQILVCGKGVFGGKFQTARHGCRNGSLTQRRLSDPILKFSDVENHTPACISRNLIIQTLGSSSLRHSSTEVFGLLVCKRLMCDSQCGPSQKPPPIGMS